MTEVVEPAASAVAIEVEGAVVSATIDRPRALNAIDLSVIAGLEAMIEQAERAEAKVVVVRGAGGTFCAGADLHALHALLDDPPALRSFMVRLGAALERIASAPWVTVAVVEGYAVAGGCELLLACDVVVTSTEARIGDRHVEYGLVPAGGASVRLPLVAPALQARYLLLTGEMVTGTRAVELGMATVAVAPDELDEEVERIVGRLRSRGRSTLATIKAMLDDGDGAARRARLDREIELFVAHATEGEDVRTGLAAFRDGVDPAFD